MTDGIILSISPSVFPVAVSEASSLSTVILRRRAVIHCMHSGQKNLPGLNRRTLARPLSATVSQNISEKQGHFMTF